MIESHIRNFLNDMGLDSFEDIGFLYQDYINECSDLVKAINNSIHIASAKNIEQQIHNLKGVSANLYVQPVFEKATVLNDYLKEHIDLETSNQVILDLWQEVCHIYDQTINELVDFFLAQDIVLEKLPTN